MAPSGSIGGCGQHAGRRALPPLDIKCSTVWHSFPTAVAKARWWPRLHASPPGLTSGGRAMIPYQGSALQHRRRQWSLPAHVHRMPGCSRRLRMTHCWMISTSSFVESVDCDRAVKSLWKLWMSSFRWNACEHAYLSRCARDSSEDAPVPNAGPSRSWCQNACAVHPECARSVSKWV
jgi:hypothetical protein